MIYIPEHVERILNEYAAEQIRENENLYRTVAGRLNLPVDAFANASEIVEFDIEEQIRKARELGEILEQSRKFSRRSILKSGGKHLIDFAQHIQGILTGFTEMKAIVTGAAGPFGSVAYGGLHVLLSIGIHKARREDSIKATLQDLALMMPRMRKYQFSLNIYEENEANMWKPLIAVYIAAMKFPAAAIKYYTQSSLKRFLRLLYKPEQQVKEIAAELRNLTMNINDEAIGEIYTEQRRQRGEQNRQGEDIRDLRNERRKDKVDKHNRRIQKLMRDLNVSGNDSIAHTVKDLESLLDGVFSRAVRPAGRKDKVLKEITYQELIQVPEYLKWMDCPLSSLLVLSGENYDSHVSRTGLNWVSSAICEVTSHLPSECARAVYCPRRLDRHSRGSGHRAISTTIFQIMEADEELCGTMFDEIKTAARKEGWMMLDFASMLEYLVQVVTAASSEKIFILYDRIDLLDDELLPIGIMSRLLKLLSIPGKVVKILVTLDRAHWISQESLLLSNDGEYLRDGLEDDQLLLKLHWTQPEADDPPCSKM